MFFSPENMSTGIELEIARTAIDLRMYLTVFSLEPYPFAKGKVPAIIIADDNRYEILADRFEGGQRFLLPAEIYQQILDALSSNQTVTIILGRYRSEIIGLGFPAAYAQINS